MVTVLLLSMIWFGNEDSESHGNFLWLGMPNWEEESYRRLMSIPSGIKRRQVLWVLLLSLLLLLCYRRCINFYYQRLAESA